MSPAGKKAKKGGTKGSKKNRSKTPADEAEPSTLDVGASEIRSDYPDNWINDGEGSTEYEMALDETDHRFLSESQEYEDDGTAEEDNYRAAEMHRSSIEGPAPTPLLDEDFEGVSRPNDLEVALKMALEKIVNMPMVDFLQNITNQADIHAQAVESAKEIANDFVANAADLAEAMQLILQYDQLMLDKLNHTTAYDFGVKPKTDEETRAVMIDRAERMLNLGQMQYDMSHQISESARPLVDYRFDACDDFNAIHDKISGIQAAEVARKEAEANKKEAKKIATAEAPKTEGPAEQQNAEERAPSKDDVNAAAAS